MSNNSSNKWKKCPICGNRYNKPPAISRKDNKTLICPNCGTEEALEDYRFFMENENHIPRID